MTASSGIIALVGVAWAPDDVDDQRRGVLAAEHIVLGEPPGATPAGSVEPHARDATS